MSDYTILGSSEKYNRDSHASLLLDKEYIKKNNDYLSLALSLLNKDCNIGCLNYIKKLGTLNYLESFSNHDYSVLKGRKRVDLKAIKKAVNAYDNAKLLGSKSTGEFGGLETLFYLTEFIKEKEGNLINNEEYTLDILVRRLNFINEAKNDCATLTPLPKKPASIAKQESLVLPDVYMSDFDNLNEIDTFDMIDRKMEAGTLQEISVLDSLPVSSELVIAKNNFINMYVSARIPVEGCDPQLRDELENEAFNDYRDLTNEQVKCMISEVNEDIKNGVVKPPVISREQAFKEINEFFKKQ